MNKATIIRKLVITLLGSVGALYGMNHRDHTSVIIIVVGVTVFLSYIVVDKVSTVRTVRPTKKPKQKLDKLNFEIAATEAEDVILTNGMDWPNYSEAEVSGDNVDSPLQGVDVATWERDGAVSV